MAKFEIKFTPLWGDIEKFFKGKDPHVKLGILASKGGGKEHQSGGVTIAEVGAFHEFGTRFAPQRSFIRSTFDNNPELAAVVTAAVRETFKKGLKVKRALDIIGAWGATAIKKKITSGIPPALAPETIRQKGSALPLVDTGQLINSITWESKP